MILVKSKSYHIGNGAWSYSLIKNQKIRFASLKPAKRIAQCFVYMSRDDRARTDDLRNVTAAL